MSRLGRGTLCHEGGGSGVGDGGGALCWALLLPGLGWPGPEVIEDVLGESVSRCRRGARLGLGLGFGCRLKPWCANGFGCLLDGGLRARASLGRGTWRRRVARDGDGFGGPFGRLFCGLGFDVLEEDVAVVVVVVAVVGSEAEKRAVGDGRGSWAVQAGVGCWVL